MVTDGIASLSIHSESRSAAEISAILGIAPSRSGDKGDVVSKRPGSRVLDATWWAFDVSEPPDDTGDGLGSLRLLVRQLAGLADVLADLRSDCDVRIWWSASSDSGQGGFVLPAELLRDLAALGCDLMGTIYLDDEAGADRS